MDTLEDFGFRKVPSGKTVAYFATDACAFINSHVLRLLERESNGGNARICLHASPDDLTHDMIILERRGHYFPPHRHTKSETWHIISGMLSVTLFGDDGHGKRTYILNRNLENIVARAAPMQWHFVHPMSDVVIYHESKSGPFLGDADREFAPWADKVKG